MLFKFVCISISCVLCLFGHTQLASVAAVPFEYNEDHEQYPYDLETEQSKAKYDTRLLSQQLRKEQKSSEESSIDGVGDQQAGLVMHNGVGEKEKAEHMNDNDDLQPHERAASCYTREHIYTHGQKVPRLDPCEVCLCMDGEIFCWWEKCEKRKLQKPDSKSVKTTSKIQHEKKSLMKSNKLTRPTMSQFQTHSNNDKAVFESHNNQVQNQRITNSFKEQIYQQNIQGKQQKVAQQQKNQEHKKQQQQNQEKQQQKSHKHNKHSSMVTSAVSSSKIMNFPENLPSLLYYDYHTEEHEHHQHQHHQQHLKHQLQKKIQKLQRERNWQQQQQQQQHKQEQEHQQKTKLLITNGVPLPLTTSEITPSISAHHFNNGLNTNSVSSTSMLTYDDLQTDGDILPEPPTKKPKASPALTTATVSTSFTALDRKDMAGKFNERQESNLYDNDAEHAHRKQWNTGEVHRLYVGETSATSSIFATDDVIEINKNIDKNPQKTTSQQAYPNIDVEANNSNNNDEDQDDAFHRWLASTETYNDYRKNKNSNNNNDKNNYVTKNNNDSLSDENMPYGSENLYATESSEYENPFGIQNLTINSQRNNKNNNKPNNNSRNNKNGKNGKNGKNNKNNNNDSNRSNKLLYPKEQEHAQNAENGFLHGAFNNDYGDYNGSVVNIDISLTTQDESSQQQGHQQKLQHPNFEKQAETEQLPRTPASIMFAADLILSPGSTKQTAKTINDTKISVTQMVGSTPEDTDKQNSKQTDTTTMATIVSTASPMPIATSSISNVQFIKHNSSVSEQGTGTESGSTSMGSTSSTASSERQCNVMGTLYKIGEILPQDTGNCLQCICIDGLTSDDTPRVTCSPHNCPPLVLPDLFDATGY